MTDSIVDVPTITHRVSGKWSDPRELLERLPDGFRLGPETLILLNQTAIEFVPMAPDDQFPQVFRSAYRRPPSPKRGRS